MFGASHLIVFGLLISLCLFGVLGLSFFNQYSRKISSLSVSYSSFIVLIALLSLKNVQFSNILTIFVSLLVVFSVNLLIGIGIAKNIAEAQSKDES